ncbi:hypothetical protein MVLG_02427 [Microbotryum lychnidis-dioicae p1A1 Lamole]|uniref:Cupin type-2 domain-containing protein n=1 Tax=Microbotryum lychnidis-dioicae (strain p1A1 Lamole / MvSl-1064) TaxID=683840 RepID=U5H549_USTV1|nr:hypothetical protein MVLG_02427 [Microbotryum lychnidis-dioicae p1A1 Lamole]|eukprot:KDE07387.1 hypothetical protein MVLG_02427 [Microbotryum lychnidis-dioicae p1A1 Lamole]
MSGIPQSNLPPVRRVVTTHSDDGTAKVWIDEEVLRVSPPGFTSGVAFALPWVTEHSPADCQTTVDGKTLPVGELTRDEGSVVRYVEFEPGHVSPMHRTTSLDYGFVIFGKLEMHLPDGSVTTVNPGDVVVQRGTNHQWVNPSKTEWARMVYVLLPSKPVVINGEELAPISIH